MALSILFPLYRYFFGKECVAWRSSCSWFEWEPAILPNSTRIESCWLVHFSIRRFWFCKCFVFFHSDCSLFVVIPSELSKTPKTETKSIFVCGEIRDMSGCGMNHMSKIRLLSAVKVTQKKWVKAAICAPWMLDECAQRARDSEMDIVRHAFTWVTAIK